MLQYVWADISTVKADVIVNASNGVGYMGGVVGRFFRLKGVAESLHYATQGKLEKEAKIVARKRKPMLGEVFITSSHSLQSNVVFHAVTMMKPGQRSNIQTVRLCLRNIVEEARKLNVRTIALPLLGTGTGKIPKEKVRELYERILRTIADLEFIVIERF